MAKFHVDLMLLEGGSIMYLIVLFGQKGDQKEVGLWKQIFRFSSSSSFTPALCIALCIHQRHHGNHPNHSPELEKERRKLVRL